MPIPASAQQNTGRLFFALWPDEETAKRLVERQAALEGGRLSHVHDLHLTLAFLGVQPVERLAGLKSVIDVIDFSAIDVVLDRYGEFSKQKVVWAGAGQEPAALHQLHDRLLQMPALAPLAFRREARFVPHVTLARKTQAPQAHFEPIFWRAARIALAESVGGDSLPRYRLLAYRDENGA